MIEKPQITWRDDKTPVSNYFDDPYFSVEDGLQESKYVFLKHNNLPERWQHHPGTFTIMETGFGTGLNFLCCWQAFDEYKNFVTNEINNTSSTRESYTTHLHFISIEKYPLSKLQLKQALSSWPPLAKYTELLTEQYDTPMSGIQHFTWPSSGVSLTLYFMDVFEALPKICAPVNACFLDGFAPSKNPDMWSDVLFQQLRRLGHETHLYYGNYVSSCASNGDNNQVNNTQCLHPSLTSVATFTAAGIVKRGLKGAGFNTEKVAGFGRKREMLVAHYDGSVGPERHTTSSWLSKSRPYFDHQIKKQPTTVVIGAGLAGCQTARSLADSGHQVYLIDPLGIAGGASGNPQGGLYVKLAADQNTLHSDFYLQAFHSSIRNVEYYLGEGNADNPYWEQCGVLQLAYNEKERGRQQKYIERNRPPESFVTSISSEEAEEITCSKGICGGIFFPSAGWVDPRALCRALVDTEANPFAADISKSANMSCKIITIKKRVVQLISPQAKRKHIDVESSIGTKDPGNLFDWQVKLDDGSYIDADHVVLSTAWETNQLFSDSYIPVKSIRGQITYCDDASTPKLKTVLCGKHYVAPPRNGQYCIGATYKQNDIGLDLRDEENIENIGHWRDFGEAWKSLENTKHVISGRAGIRCTTPDYLPIVGPLVNSDEMIRTFASLTRNGKRIPNKSLPNIPGLWINIGHGSRGLASTALSAQILTAYINQTTLPTSHDIAEALLPARFLIRDLVRNKLPEPLSQLVKETLQKRRY